MKILLLYTGGTIGMRKSENGYVPQQGYLDSMLKNIPELLHPSMPIVDVLEFESLIDSSNATIGFWNKIVAIIQDKYSSYDGFVILHGTDTMAYASSALSFMIQGLSKPILFTGSQIPLCEIRSDARENIITSLIIASSFSLSEVCVYFNGKLFRGNRLQKTSVSGFDAFYSHNYPLLGSVGVKFDIERGANVQDVHLEPSCKRKGDVVFFQTIDENVRVSVLTIFPGMSEAYCRAVLSDTFHAVVIDSFGAGNAPSNSMGKWLRKLIKELIAKQILVVIKTQCSRGSVSFGFYQTSLKETGAVSARDMTFEAIIAKLYYVLSVEALHYEQRVELFETSLCGEMKD